MTEQKHDNNMRPEKICFLTQNRLLKETSEINEYKIHRS